jgi:hypothetical protein
VCSRSVWAFTSKVKYANFDYPHPDWLSWGPALFKDLAYRFEREIRLVATWPKPTNADCDFFKIPVDPRPLIEKVILHPHAYSSFRQRVAELVRKHLHKCL